MYKKCKSVKNQLFQRKVKYRPTDELRKTE